MLEVCHNKKNSSYLPDDRVQPQQWKSPPQNTMHYHIAAT